MTPSPSTGERRTEMTMTQSDLTARIDEHLARLARLARPPVYVEIVDPSGRVSYRRWSDHPDVLEALGTQGYTVQRCPQQPDLGGEAHPDRALLVESVTRIRNLEAQLAAQAEALARAEGLIGAWQDAELAVHQAEGMARTHPSAGHALVAACGQKTRAETALNDYLPTLGAQQ